MNNDETLTDFSQWILEPLHWHHFFLLFKHSALSDIRMGWFPIGCGLNASGFSTIAEAPVTW